MADRERLERSEGLRYAWHTLQLELPEALRPLLDAQARDPQREALLVDPDGPAFRAPHQGWHDLDRSPAQARMFEALVAHRRSHPGQELDPQALQEAIWPGEQITASSAANRLYVNVSKLRKAGLGDLLERGDLGYRLPPDLRIVIVEQDRPLSPAGRP